VCVCARLCVCVQELGGLEKKCWTEEFGEDRCPILFSFARRYEESLFDNPKLQNHQLDAFLTFPSTFPAFW